MDSEEIEKYVAAQIKKARDIHSLTQSQLADRIKLTQRAISQYEIGNRKVSVGVLFLIALALDEPITFFYPQQPFE